MTRPIISTEKLGHSYGPIRALSNVSVDVFEDDYIAIIGQNGSGKSTLVKHFNGLLMPTSGRVLVDGEDTRQADVRKLSSLVGYVFQNPDHMLFATTVEAEVSLGPKNLGLPRNEIATRVDSALKVTGLERYRAESPFFLGKGLRRMVTLAAVIAMEPKVIVIDEPTTGMDFRGYAEVMKIVDLFYEQGKVILIITHDMKLVAEHSKRVIAMLDGEIVMDEATRSAFQKAELLEKCHLKTRPAIQVAQQLQSLGIRQDVLTCEELVQDVKKNILNPVRENDDDAYSEPEVND